MSSSAYRLFSEASCRSLGHGFTTNVEIYHHLHKRDDAWCNATSIHQQFMHICTHEQCLLAHTILPHKYVYTYMPRQSTLLSSNHPIHSIIIIQPSSIISNTLISQKLMHIFVTSACTASIPLRCSKY